MKTCVALYHSHPLLLSTIFINVESNAMNTVKPIYTTLQQFLKKSNWTCRKYVKIFGLEKIEILEWRDIKASTWLNILRVR